MAPHTISAQVPFQPDLLTSLHSTRDLGTRQKGWGGGGGGGGQGELSLNIEGRFLSGGIIIMIF